MWFPPRPPRPVWPRTPLTRRHVPALVVVAALALLVRWHAGAAPALVDQAFFGVIIAIISTIAAWLGAAGGAIATASLVVINWLTTSVGWLGRRFLDIVKATGGMFAKVWDVSKKFWFDVVRPALQKVAKWIGELRDWLKKKIGPIIRLIERLHGRILDIYKRFVRPLLDALDQTRGILKILIALHVPFAKALDRYLEAVEATIVKGFEVALADTSKIWDFLDSIVTGDLLFQRVPFLRTLQRDAPLWLRMFWNSQVIGLTPDEIARLKARKYPALDPAKPGRELTEFYQTGGGALGPVIQELVPLWNASAGAK